MCHIVLVLPALLPVLVDCINLHQYRLIFRDPVIPWFPL